MALHQLLIGHACMSQLYIWSPILRVSGARAVIWAHLSTYNDKLDYCKFETLVD